MTRCLLAPLLAALSCTPQEVDALDELAERFGDETAGLRSGRCRYPLPEIEAGLKEVAYLEALAERLGDEGAGCDAALLASLELFSAYRRERKASLFFHAAWLLAREREMDFFERSSKRIRPTGLSPVRSGVVPLEPDKQVELLRQRIARVEMAERALRALRSLAPALDGFLTRCPEERAALRPAISYFLKP
ncbi:MAG: hypothetical protein JXR96_06945 [Deltaproteobacteria bacterium]|nr:hypothetical protein [Deltaproteobacteria bacterium]